MLVRFLIKGVVEGYLDGFSRIISMKRVMIKHSGDDERFEFFLK